MDNRTRQQLIEWAEKYNDPVYFQEDPIIFPGKFAEGYRNGLFSKADVEIAAVFAAHLAWGRRSMIVRDCGRLFDEMNWSPYGYIMNGEYRNDRTSLHRTVKWSDFAMICGRLKDMYSARQSMEGMSVSEIRGSIFGSKDDPVAPNKKINMMRRWLVRDDGKVDLGIWKETSAADLLIPLDVHVHATATAMGLTERKAKDMKTVLEITDVFNDIFPGDPCKGDYALFGYGVTH